MTTTHRHPAVLLIASLALAMALLAFASTPASAAVGVETASNHYGPPGAKISLTLGCGFCFPPCVGPKGERHPKGFDRGPCMLGAKEDPPASFGVSLVRSDDAPQRHSCGTGPICTPLTLGPPHQAPFTFLGRAVPPPGGNNPEHGDPPRYRLLFTIPDVSPGIYTYEIWCDVCADGRRGALIGVPSSRLWRLVVWPPPGEVEAVK